MDTSCATTMPSSIDQQFSYEFSARRGKCKLVHSRATLRSVAKVHGRAVVVQSCSEWVTTGGTRVAGCTVALDRAPMRNKP